MSKFEKDDLYWIDLMIEFTVKASNITKRFKDRTILD